MIPSAEYFVTKGSERFSFGRNGERKLRGGTG